LSYHGQRKVKRRQRREEEGRIPDSLDRGRPVLHKVAAANKDNLRGGIFEQLLGLVVSGNLSLSTNRKSVNRKLMRKPCKVIHTMS